MLSAVPPARQRWSSWHDPPGLGLPGSSTRGASRDVCTPCTMQCSRHLAALHVPKQICLADDCWRGSVGLWCLICLPTKAMHTGTKFSKARVLRGFVHTSLHFSFSFCTGWFQGCSHLQWHGVAPSLSVHGGPTHCPAAASLARCRALSSLPVARAHAHVNMRARGQRRRLGVLMLMEASACKSLRWSLLACT